MERRPLGSQFPSPFSPKDIAQYHFNYSFNTVIRTTNLKVSFTTSEHQNNHNRPDIIDSRFQDAMLGNGGPSENERWNIFEPNKNSQTLIDYVRGAEKSEKIGSLSVIDIIGRNNFNNFYFAVGTQISNENLDITYNDIARAEFDENGEITKIADLFF